MEEALDMLCRLLQAGLDPEEVELEARIRGQIVSERSVECLLRSGICTWRIATYAERKRLSKTNRKCTYRHRSAGDVPESTRLAERERFGLELGVLDVSDEVVCKSSILRAEAPRIWCTLHVSTEMSVPSMFHSLSSVDKTVSTRLRGEVLGYWVDVTLTAESDPRVEVEAPDSKLVDGSSMIRAIEVVCCALQESPAFVERFDWITAKHLVNSNIGSKYQRPVTMTLKELKRIFSGSWVVTPKVDGVRCFVISLERDIFSVDLRDNVRYVCSLEEDVLGTTILDCEYLGDVYYVIDIALYRGRYVGKRNLDTRLGHIDDVLDIIPADRLAKKPYKTFKSLEDLSCMYRSLKKSYAIDGLVFVDKNRGYTQQAVKWKEHNTVDLEVIKGDNGLYEAFTSDHCLVDNVELDKELSPGIWEFKATARGTLAPIKPRPDKPNANSYNIVVNNTQKSVPGAVFEGVGCYLMRKYHNKVKYQMLLSIGVSGATILDIGTGQGGDISKWRGAKEVCCVEPSHDSVREMEQRLASSDVRVSVIRSFVRDINEADIPSGIDIFTAFFCINQWDNEDWDKLESIVKSRGTTRCALLCIVLTHPSRNDSSCFTIVQGRQGRYSISIHETRIVDIQERALNIRRFSKVMLRCGLVCCINSRLRGQSEIMTTQERKLSSMYTALAYKRAF